MPISTYYINLVKGNFSWYAPQNTLAQRARWPYYLYTCMIVISLDLWLAYPRTLQVGFTMMSENIFSGWKPVQHSEYLEYAFIIKYPISIWIKLALSLDKAVTLPKAVLFRYIWTNCQMHHLQMTQWHILLSTFTHSNSITRKKRLSDILKEKCSSYISRDL